MFGQPDNTQQNDIAIPDHVADEVAAQTPAAQPQAWQHPGTPLNAPAAAVGGMTVVQPIHDIVAPGTQQITPSDGAGDGIVDNELMGIKQQALGQLSPLVGHLEQTPEERFRTTMMMIQASDDQSLIKTAYEAAQAIEDEKSRAQALLDVINEINYFTQQHNS